MSASTTPGRIIAPDDLTERDQWVLWRYEARNGKPTKVPYQVNARKASSTDPSTWTTFEAALDSLRQVADQFDGIGFVFTPEDPYCGIDLDDCIDDGGNIKAWAQPIIASFPDTYTEISPSGHGVKIFACAVLPGDGKKVYVDESGKIVPKEESAGAIEIYDRERYFTITGSTLNGAPLQVEDHDADVTALYERISGAAGRKLKAKVDLHTQPKFPEGQRHDYLISVAAQYRAKGMERPEILAAVEAVNQERCSQPKSRDEVEKIVDWVCQKPAGPGRSLAASADQQASEDNPSEHQLRRGAPADGPSIFDKLTPYPKPLGSAAYYGIAGRFVRLAEPHTEADPNFLLISFLIHAGNILGRDAFVWAGGDKHHTNLFGCAVGPTSTGRKGSAASPVRMFFEPIDEEWVRAITSGLSTGEGLITAVRDPVFKRETVSKGRGFPKALENVCIDAGVPDKRVLVIQSEFYGALAAMKRQGNTLSATMRDAWDKGDLRTMVKNSPAKATGAHISIIANITRDELLRGMLVDDFDNGFSNRFLWICSQRSKELPEGGALWQVDFGPLQRDFIRAAGLVKGAVTRDAGASDDWGYDDAPGGAYRYLTRERGGMYGAVTARAAAQVLRLSLIYALLDGSDKIRREHLEAALEVWRYCEESAAFIFGDATGDPTADAIMTALRAAGTAGMTRLELTDFFKRNKPSSELSRALLVLHRGGQARFEREPTAGRPTERWFAINGTEGRQ